MGARYTGRVHPYREHPVHPALRHVLSCYWTRSGAASAPRRILPDGAIDLLFEVSASRAVFVGAMTRPRLLAPGPVRTFVAARFRPGGAWPFLGVPASELTDTAATLAHLWTDSDRVADAVWGASDPEEGVARLESALLARLSGAPVPERWLMRGVDRLWKDPAVRVGGLAAELGCSRQHLSRRVKAVVGYGPKQLARIGRIQRVIGRVREGPADDWARLANEYGFADQSHLIGDFRDLVGTTPGLFRQQA